MKGLKHCIAYIRETVTRERIRELLIPSVMREYPDIPVTRNAQMLRITAFVGIIAAGIAMVLETALGLPHRGAAVVYFVFFLFLVVLLFEYKKEMQEHPLIALYLFYGCLLLFDTLSEGSRGGAVMVFPMILIVFAFSVVDYPIRILLFELVMSVLYFLISWVVAFQNPAEQESLPVIAAALVISCGLCITTSAKRVQLFQVTSGTRQEALHDGLTGLYNRRGGYTAIHQLVCSGVSGTFILMDIDNFKHINDTYGHERGDQALQAVSAVLAADFQAMDIVMRMGGDEFIIYAVGLVDVHFVDDRMSAVREDMHGIVLDEASGDHVSISAGCIINLGSYPSYESLYAAADHLLYDVKEHGKDGYRVTDREYQRTS